VQRGGLSDERGVARHSKEDRIKKGKKTKTGRTEVGEK